MAKRFFTKHALNVFTLELDMWEFPVHYHNFYELIFIEFGSGIHTVNGVSVQYSNGDIFLLTPRDEHCFKIEAKTTFTFLKFTEQLFIEKTESVIKGNWQKRIDAALCNPNTYPGSIISKDDEAQKLFTILKVLKDEFGNKNFFGRKITLELFGVLITIIARSINEKNTFLAKGDFDKMKGVDDMLGYIRQNICNKQKLTLMSLAAKFNYSPNYVGIFIKKQTGLSLQKIILETKIKTAERLLTSSQFSIKEIAHKLNFSDVSHFSKTFKNVTGATPSAHRILNVK